MWDAQVAAFAPRYRVVRYDAQGFGRSPMATAPRPRAEDLLRVMQSLDIQRAHLVGLSMGGSTAIDFTLEHPAMVGSLVAVAAGLSGLDRTDAWLDEQNRLEDEAVERGDFDSALRVDLQTWLAGPKRRLDDMDPALVQALAPMARAVLEGDLERKPTPQIEPTAAGRLGEISAPTLVIVGDADAPLVVRTAEVLANGIRDARLLVLPDTAHMVNLERPAEFNQVVLEFLAQHPIR
jgi:pimeloyl-ACP methyl ester carboxylesterase